MHADYDLYNNTFLYIYHSNDASCHKCDERVATRDAPICYLLASLYHQPRTNMSSSPLPIPSSDDDIEMAIDDELPQTPTPHGGQSMSQAPPPADPLFLSGTPSTQAGTPLRGLVARRAVGMDSTPRRNVANSPLFARKWLSHFAIGFIAD